MNSLPSIYFYDQIREELDHFDEVVAGLCATEKYISPKFFYDERGSELFTEITQQPEYYLTQTEIRMLERHAAEISELIGDDFLLIEYGSGSSTKIRILLEQLRPAIYAPLDISRQYLADAAEALAREYPWLEVHAACVDFTDEFDLPFASDKRKVSFFPGSSIGNFERHEAADFLARVRRLVGSNGGLLLGVDLKKDPDVLHAAYNDSAGVTAAFNLNVLAHLEDRYAATMNREHFRHEAFYNEALGCIQMFLISEEKHTIQIGEHLLPVAKGERIHTENSHKYTIDEIETMARRAGFEEIHLWQDDNEWFALFYLH